MAEIQQRIDIAYIGGGSMNFGWKLMGEICQDETLSGTIRLYDIDKKLSLANEVIGNKIRELPECKTNMIFIAVDTLEEALRNADFVIISITAGDINEQVSDIQVPELYGIYQAAGDNTGPGGVMRALRTLPEYIKFAKKIEELCPNAWVISMSEPMSACLKTLYMTFPKIKAFGCSNDIFQTQDIIADFTEEYLNVDNISRREIKTNVIGINKFCWINEALYNGDNLFNIYDSNARKYADNGYEKKKLDYRNNPYACAHKVKFDMFLRYGVIAASSDRYLADSCPPWYLSSPRNALNWKVGMMTTAFMRKYKAEKITKARKLINGDESLHLNWSGTDCIAQIKAILGHCNVITNVVMQNIGQIPNIPLGAVVETNAFISKNNVKPVFAGAVPEDILVLIGRLVANNNMLVDAVLAKDLDSAFNAFLNDSLMTLDINKATELFKQMLSCNKSHLEYYC